MHSSQGKPVDIAQLVHRRKMAGVLVAVVGGVLAVIVGVGVWGWTLFDWALGVTRHNIAVDIAERTGETVRGQPPSMMVMLVLAAAISIVAVTAGTIALLGGIAVARSGDYRRLKMVTIIVLVAWGMVTILYVVQTMASRGELPDAAGILGAIGIAGGLVAALVAVAPPRSGVGVTGAPLPPGQQP